HNYIIIMRNFRKLSVWEKSHQLTLDIYKSTTNFPKEERYGLTSQMRRSPASIPTNIAEGCGRDSQPQFVRFLSIASGSASELENQIILAKDLKFLNSKNYKQLTSNVTEVKRLLTSLHSKVKADG